MTTDNEPRIIITLDDDVWEQFIEFIENPPKIHIDMSNVPRFNVRED